MAVRPTVTQITELATTNGEALEPVFHSSNGLTQAVPAGEHHVVSHRMEHFTRPPTSSGGRNMQDTTFSLSAEYPSN